MELKDTVKLMESKDYKERFQCEYFQVKIRLEKLQEMLKKYKMGTLPFKPTTSYELLFGQAETMKAYKEILEKRAEIEDVDLTEVKKND